MSSNEEKSFAHSGSVTAAVLVLLRQGRPRFLMPHQEEDLVRFFQAMVHTLENPQNRDKTGWVGCTVPSLMEHLQAEVKELQELLDNSNKDPTGDATLREAADIANMAMMVASNQIRLIVADQALKQRLRPLFSTAPKPWKERAT